VIEAAGARSRESEPDLVGHAGNSTGRTKVVGTPQVNWQSPHITRFVFVCMAELRTRLTRRPLRREESAQVPRKVLICNLRLGLHDLIGQTGSHRRSELKLLYSTGYPHQGALGHGHRFHR
jgi:hypothetical protein